MVRIPSRPSRLRQCNVNVRSRDRAPHPPPPPPARQLVVQTAVPARDVRAAPAELVVPKHATRPPARRVHPQEFTSRHAPSPPQQLGASRGAFPSLHVQVLRCREERSLGRTGTGRAVTWAGSMFTVLSTLWFSFGADHPDSSPSPGEIS